MASPLRPVPDFSCAGASGPMRPRAFRFLVLLPLSSVCSSNERLVALLMSLVYVAPVQKVCTLLSIHTPHIFQEEKFFSHPPHASYRTPQLKEMVN